MLKFKSYHSDAKETQLTSASVPIYQCGPSSAEIKSLKAQVVKQLQKEHSTSLSFRDTAMA